MYQFILLIHILLQSASLPWCLSNKVKVRPWVRHLVAVRQQTVFGSRGSGSFLFRLTMSFALFFLSPALPLII